jgi:hypothetical protein
VDNLELWRLVERTDPAATKQFAGKGGFRGTAISPMYLIKKATEVWGPMGDKWGIRINSAHVFRGAPLLGKDGTVVGRELLHIVVATVYYPGPSGAMGEIPCFGQTILAGQRKGGEFFTDEEAPKKSLTDALAKGLSWLGFAADIHMGRFDDSKYVEQLRSEFARGKTPDRVRQVTDRLADAASKGSAALDACWLSLSKEDREMAQAKPEMLKAYRIGAKDVDREAANAETP